ncbi:hypothetical protein AKJ57_05690, partial [candidate division MSBL1 archaeon SCGC-AAA259A05]
MISYKNLDEVEKRIKYERENAPGKVLFCPDTNVLYHNFLSSLERIDPENVGIVTTVKDEIEVSMRLKDRYQNLFSELTNPKHLTLTFRRSWNLESLVERAFDCFRKLRRRKIL